MGSAGTSPSSLFAAEYEQLLPSLIPSEADGSGYDYGPSLLLVHFPILHHELHLLQHADVLQPIRPGSNVILERSITLAPAGIARSLPTASILFVTDENTLIVRYGTRFRINQRGRL